ncbi:MAG: hypothetical protein KC657_13860 [Myxococcales bacterium]|nr:hypothetical protein [Myxococcales bacterium]
MKLLERIAPHAPLLVAATLALPTLLAYYPPMSDLPHHEAMVGLLRNFNDPSIVPHGLYRINLGHPNQLFHLLGALLSFVVGTRWAVKLVITASQLLIFWSGARLADHVGRSRWSTLLLAPLALGFTYYWGLVANLIGYAAFFFALPLMDRFAKTPTWRGAGKLCAAMLLLDFAHGSVFQMGTGVIALFALCYPLRLRATALRLVPAAAAVVLTLVHLWWQQRFYTPSVIEVPTRFFSLWTKLILLPNVLFGAHDLPALLLLCIISLVGLVALLGARIRHDTRDPDDAPPRGKLERVRAWALRYRFEIVGALFVLAYWTAPFNWKGATLIHERFLGPGFGILAICAAPRAAVPRIAKFVLSVLPVGIMLLSWPQFLDSHQTYKDLEYIIARLPTGRSIGILVLDRAVYRTRIFSVGPGGGRVLAERGGRVSFAFTASPIAPVQMTPRYRWDEYDIRTFALGTRGLKPEHDLKRFHWLVVYSREPIARRLLKKAMKPYAQLIDQSGDWLLYESNAPEVTPLLADDPADPREPTILDMVNKLVDEEREAKARGEPPPE